MTTVDTIGKLRAAIADLPDDMALWGADPEGYHRYPMRITVDAVEIKRADGGPIGDYDFLICKSSDVEDSELEEGDPRMIRTAVALMELDI